MVQHLWISPVGCVVRQEHQFCCTGVLRILDNFLSLHIKLCIEIIIYHYYFKFIYSIILLII